MSEKMRNWSKFRLKEYILALEKENIKLNEENIKLKEEKRLIEKAKKIHEKYMNEERENDMSKM